MTETKANTPFALDAQLQADTWVVADLGLCKLLLMNDANYPWLIMVPRSAGAEEIIDLDPRQQHALMDEIATVSTALQTITGADKLNVAALGNMVRQLHVHVIARFADDDAWPGPIWGKVAPKPYDETKASLMVVQVRDALGLSLDEPS